MNIMTLLSLIAHLQIVILLRMLYLYLIIIVRNILEKTVLYETWVNYKSTSFSENDLAQY